VCSWLAPPWRRRPIVQPGDTAMLTTTPAFSATASGRPSWSGLLQLSLVGIPLKAYPAVRSREVSHFHQYHAACGQRIRYAKQCPVHGPVDGAAIVKGYEYGPGQHLVLEAEDLDPLRPAQDRALRLERFLEPAQFDPLLFSGRSLHLLADGLAAAHAYAVLCQALVQRGRWAVGRMVLSGQRQLVLVRPAGTVLVLHVLHYPELVRASAPPAPLVRASAPSAAPPQTEPTEELQLAGQLIDAASSPIDWSRYRDETAQDLRTLIEAKLQGRPEAETEAPVILPLLEALQQSLASTPKPAAAPPAPRKNGRKPAAPRKRAQRTA
jgi:DNA end-binding protein Ku